MSNFKVFVIAVFLFGFLNSVGQNIISTVAGNGAASFVQDGAVASKSPIKQPSNLAVDKQGNIFFVEQSSTIRKIAAGTGILTTVAGQLGSGGCDLNTEPATSSYLNYPGFMALDNNGNIYISESNCGLIHKVNVNTGITTVIAGNGSPGFSGDSGLATNARINPYGVGVDDSGNVFFADATGYCYRRVDAKTGIINTVVGGGTSIADSIPALTAKLSMPLSVTIDHKGNLYLCFVNGENLYKVDAATGIFKTMVGSYLLSIGDGGPAKNASLDLPESVVLDDSNNIYIAETGRNRVRKITASTGIINTIAGDSTAGYNGDSIIATKAELKGPTGIALDGNGNLYIAEATGERIRKVGCITSLSATFNPGVSCYGHSDGNVILNVKAGIPPYLFSINGGAYQASDTFSNLSTGTYAFAVIDSSNCKVMDSIMVPSPLPLAITSNVINNSGGLNNGTITLNGTGGTPGYTFKWADSVTGPGRTNLAVGTYKVTITDANGCSASQTFTLVQCNFTSTVQVKNNSCFDVKNDSVTVHASNGALPYTYSINAPGINQSDSVFSGVIPGTYTFTVRDSNNCVSHNTVTINQLPVITLADTVYNTNPGIDYGYIYLGVTGGTPPYQYLWNDDSTTLDRSLLAYGYYNISITDAKGCTYKAMFLVGQVDSSRIISTVAGNGAVSNGGGLAYNGDSLKAINTQVYATGVTLDSAGNLYIADEGNNLIRKVSATTGIMANVAGNRNAGYEGDGKPATQAWLYQPNGVTLDKKGNMYIADYLNHVVRKVDATTGIITTVAGTGSDIYSSPDSIGDGGPATNAILGLPQHVALDTAGNLYIADGAYNHIRRVDAATGIITTFAGAVTRFGYFGGDGGPAVDALLDAPSGLAIDNKGNLYIADAANHRIRKVVISTGIITTIAGNGIAGNTGNGGPANLAELYNPTGLAIDTANNLYIADYYNNCVRKIDLNRNIITIVAGSGTSGISGDWGPATLAEMNTPTDVAVDMNGNLFIADAGNGRVREVGQSLCNVILIDTVINATGGLSNGAIYAGATGGTKTYSYHWSDNDTSMYRTGLSNSSYKLTVTDTRGCSVTGTFLIYSPDTSKIITTVAGSGPVDSGFTDNGGYTGDGGLATAATLNLPSGEAFDHQGNFYIADWSNNVIRKVAAGTGIITTVAGTGMYGYSGDGSLATAAQMTYPGHIAFDDSDNLYIADENNYAIRKVSRSTGIITTIAGGIGGGYSGDEGLATAAKLNYPADIAIDSANNIYIADYWNGVIRKIDVAGYIHTVAGNGIYANTYTLGYTGDGDLALDATLATPTGVTVDRQGNLYIVDGARVRKVDAVTGIINTVAGNGQYADQSFTAFNGDGGLATDAPLGVYNISIDSVGNLYLVDITNSKIRKVDAATGIITTVVDTGFGGGFLGDGGPALYATINGPTYVTINRGNMYIVDGLNNRIRMVGTELQICNVQLNTDSINNVVCGSANKGSVSLAATYGRPPFQYSIDSGVTYQKSNVFDSLVAGVYYFMVKDSNNCKATVSAMLSPNVFDTINKTVCVGGSWLGRNVSGSYNDTFPAVNGCDSIQTLNLTVLPFLSDTVSDTILIGQSDQGYDSTGVYVDTLVSYLGCDSVRTLFLTVLSNDTVWPGDANADGVADNFDLLSVGLGFGYKGANRDSINNDWVGQSCPPWQYTLFGINLNNADCNGDGVVDDNDTLAINLNYGLTHTKTNLHQRAPGAPPLYVELINGPVAAGDTAKFNILLGDSLIPANSIYGLAFSVNFNGTLLQANSIKRQFFNSWLGKVDSNMLTLGKYLPAQSRIDFALTRTDHFNRSGNGPIAGISIITIDNISGKDSIFNKLVFDLTDVKAIDNQGNLVPLDAISDTLDVFKIDGINKITTTPSLSLYPNPASRSINLVSENEITGYFIYSPEGTEVLRKENMTGKRTTINVSNLAQGLYIVQAIVNGERITKRFTVIH